jgi:hypothetical protein
MTTTDSTLRAIKYGVLVPQATVDGITAILSRMFADHPLALQCLRDVCGGEPFALFVGQQDRLDPNDLDAILDTVDSVDPTVRAVVLSSVFGRDGELRMVSPYMRDPAIEPALRQLKNGVEEPQDAVDLIVKILSTMLRYYPVGLTYLRHVCNGDPYEAFAPFEEEIDRKDLGVLLGAPGVVSDVTKHVVLSAVVGNGPTMRIVSPYADAPPEIAGPVCPICEAEPAKYDAFTSGGQPTTVGDNCARLSSVTVVGEMRN